MFKRASSSRKWPDPQTFHTLVFDFDGVFTDNKVWVFDDGREAVRCDRADGLAIDWLRDYASKRTDPLSILIVSTEQNAAVPARARKLRLECAHGVGNKEVFIRTYLAKTRPQDPEPLNGLLYVGNDLNDLDVMKLARFSVAPLDAHPRVRSVASAVLRRKGGHGFVRAFVERLLRDHLHQEG